jgi:RHS repeat-associated protein
LKIVLVESRILLLPCQYTDAESGLQYLRARYFDPATGQFASRDPMAAATAQPYAYANGNPLNGNDPSGLCDDGSGYDRTGVPCPWNLPPEHPDKLVLKQRRLQSDTGWHNDCGLLGMNCIPAVLPLPVVLPGELGLGAAVPQARTATYRERWEEIDSCGRVGYADFSVTETYQRTKFFGTDEEGNSISVVYPGSNPSRHSRRLA